ncbi:MAG TPA: hypothetical protein VGP42_11255 [Stellaceae bacterium]|jgi:hypothetical protein|nr:hypothetical protein [Stellaceae bacterium]
MPTASGAAKVASPHLGNFGLCPRCADLQVSRLINPELRVISSYPRSSYMNKSSKRGKIPQSDWPLIMARYDAGETLSSIARTYDCSPPAISYVVSRSRARQSSDVVSPSPSSAEPQLIKSPPPETGAADPRSTPPLPSVSVTAPTLAASSQPLPVDVPPMQPKLVPDTGVEGQSGNPPREDNELGGNGTVVPALPPNAAFPAAPAHSAQANGDHRRRLHLSLGNGSSAGGAAQPADSHPVERQPASVYQPYPNHDPGNGVDLRAAPAPQHGADRLDHGRVGVASAGFVEPPARAANPHSPGGNGANGAALKEGGASYIDRELRARVEGDIAAFLAAFDAALAEDTQESRSGLREATDRLLRAGARTRIELERLEARLPLQRPGTAPRAEPAWRQR